jgi:hypothetical protein
MYKFIIILLAFLVLSCETQDPPRVVVESKKQGYDNGFYYDITLKNTGEQPAYFVVLIATALSQDNVEMQRVERSFGDLFPDESEEKRFLFNKVVSQPDSIDIDITFQLTMNQGF